MNKQINTSFAIKYEIQISYLPYKHLQDLDTTLMCLTFHFEVAIQL